MQTTLTIAGMPYTAAQRAAAQIEIDFWAWDLDDDLSAEFHEVRSGPNIAPRFHCGQAVTIATNTGSGNVLRFTGEIAGISPTFTSYGWTYGYRCLGPKYQANQLWITGTDGSGTLVFNLPPDDDEYVPANSGLSVGTIIGNVLTLHAGVLTAIGITTDATTTAQLAALTVVPNEPAYLTGRVADVIQGLLDRWARNVRSFITAGGVYRFYDTTTAATTLTLTMNQDPIDPVCFQRDVRECASRVQVRGKGRIYPGYVSLTRNSSLTPAWTGGQQASWHYTDFSQPKDAFDKGTVVSVDSPTQVTVQSSDATRAWAVNFWNSREAWIYLSSSIGSALTYSEQRPVTACAAMSAGGTATVTLGYPLENAGTSAYNQYQLIGRVANLATGGLNDVWRLYNVTDPGGLIANHMVPKFPTPVPFVNYSGTSAAQTSYPEAMLVKGLVAWPATFKVMPQTGQILFDQPVVKPFNSPGTLALGGGAVVAPDDIFVLLAYSRGALTATYPADIGGLPQYGGTSFTVDGIQTTQMVDVESWVYQGNQSLMNQYAQMLWQSMCDTVVTGSVNYRGAYTAAFNPDLKLNVAGNGFTTGMESLGVPIRAFTLLYHADGQGGLNYSSQLRCSSRRNPRTGDQAYLHTTQLRQAGFKMDFGELVKVFTTEPLKKAIDKQMDSNLSDAAGTKGYKALAESLTPQAMEDRRHQQEEQQEKARKQAEQERREQPEQGFNEAGLPMMMGDGMGNFGTFGADAGGPPPPSRTRKRKRTSYNAARKQQQEAAAQRQAESRSNYRPPEEGYESKSGATTGDGKPHTFTGKAPEPRKRNLTRDQARQEWQQHAAQRAAQQAPVDMGDIENITGVGNVDGLSSRSQAPPPRDGKKHSFTGLTKDHVTPPPPTAESSPEYRASVQKAAGRRARAARPHTDLKNRHDDEEKPES